MKHTIFLILTFVCLGSAQLVSMSPELREQAQMLKHDITARALTRPALLSAAQATALHDEIAQFEAQPGFDHEVWKKTTLPLRISILQRQKWDQLQTECYLGNSQDSIFATGDANAIAHALLDATRHIAYLPSQTSIRELERLIDLWDHAATALLPKNISQTRPELRDILKHPAVTTAQSVMVLVRNDYNDKKWRSRVKKICMIALPIVAVFIGALVYKFGGKKATHKPAHV